VFILHDFYVAQFKEDELVDHFLYRTPDTPVTDQRLALRKIIAAARRHTTEKWTLKHISITKLQGIMEVFDGDASGYVSVWEANSALAERPAGWRYG
jgi:hypothetical protein